MIEKLVFRSDDGGETWNEAGRFSGPFLFPEHPQTLFEAPDGSLMMLERGHGLMFLPMVISLRHTRTTAKNAGQRLPVTTLAVLDSSLGWSVDNASRG